MRQEELRPKRSHSRGSSRSRTARRRGGARRAPCPGGRRPTRCRRPRPGPPGTVGGTESIGRSPTRSRATMRSGRTGRSAHRQCPVAASAAASPSPAASRPALDALRPDGFRPHHPTGPRCRAETRRPADGQVNRVPPRCARVIAHCVSGPRRCRLCDGRRRVCRSLAPPLTERNTTPAIRPDKTGTSRRRTCVATCGTVDDERPLQPGATRSRPLAARATKCGAPSHHPLPPRPLHDHTGLLPTHFKGRPAVRLHLLTQARRRRGSS